MKLGQSCIRLHWNTCSRPGWGDFFHPEFRVCSRVGSPELLPGPRHGEASGPQGKSRTDTEEVGYHSALCICESSFHWKLSLRGGWTWGVCPLQHLLCSFLFHILALFPAFFCESKAGVSQVCEWEPKFCVFFWCLFSNLILWETTFFLWPKTDFKGWFCWSLLFPAWYNSPSWGR